MPFTDPLPIDAFRKKIELLVKEHPVTIVTAETGAGKSTRVPYWFWKSGMKVHVTQPRRIAARSLSHFLAGTLKVALGDKIGYQTGFDQKKSRDTSLLYLTDGVKMVQEIGGRIDYDLLVIDEIHEWNLNQEVLVGLVKRKLESGFYSKKEKRVLIMSATLQAGQISSFFNQAPVISVPGRGYPVTFHRHDSQFFLADVAQMVEEKQNALVFLPGKQEIEHFILDLKRMLDSEKDQAVILPLYSELTLKEQAKVFHHYSLPKVIVATDIAQTSLTIDDIDAVVDAGVKKELKIINGIEGLYPTDISSSECRQRAGRAGRVKPGAYILCSERSMDDRPEFPDPEIRRINLEMVVLRMVKWGLDAAAFPFFHRPKRNLVVQAIKKLQIFGALDSEKKITPDGKRIVEFPVSLRGARLLLEAEKGGARVVDASLRAIAVLEAKGIVNKEFSGEKFSSGPYISDLLNQLDIWESARKNRAVISGRKLALAGEIYQELKRRVRLTNQKGNLNALEQKSLFRAIVSGFADHLYFFSDGYYHKDHEIRRIERTSLIHQLVKKPMMIAALPFDLSYTRIHPLTGGSEQLQVPLLTFCSELSWDLLDELNPFSYQKKQEITVENGRISIIESVFFGGETIRREDRQALWADPGECRRLVNLALEWAHENLHRLPLSKEKDRNREWFDSLKRLFRPGELREFDSYWDRFLNSELENHFRQQDIASFFHLHPAFRNIRLDRFLPASILRRIGIKNWPPSIHVGERELSVRRDKGRLWIDLSREDLMEINEADCILATGEKAGIRFQKKMYPDWEGAVAALNEILKEDIYKKKWFFDRKPAHMEDLLDIPFPVSFIGGRGKGDVPFEFYSAPMMEEEEVVLIHFRSLEEGRKYFGSIEKQWRARVLAFRQESLASIFRKKGWKVKE